MPVSLIDDVLIEPAVGIAGYSGTGVVATDYVTSVGLFAASILPAPYTTLCFRSADERDAFGELPGLVAHRIAHYTQVVAGDTEIAIGIDQIAARQPEVRVAEQRGAPPALFATLMPTIRRMLA